MKSDDCKCIAEVLLGSLRPVALDSLRGISSLHFFDARGHSRSFACLPSLHFLIRLEHYNTNMGVLSDCHVQVKRILPDDDFVKPQKEGFLTGVGDGDGVLSGRGCSYHYTLLPPFFCEDL